MNVGKLIELLKKMPQDAEVRIAPADYVACDVGSVKEWEGKVYISEID